MCSQGTLSDEVWRRALWWNQEATIRGRLVTGVDSSSDGSPDFLWMAVVCRHLDTLVELQLGNAYLGVKGEGFQG